MEKYQFLDFQQLPIVWKNPEYVMCFPTFPPHSDDLVRLFPVPGCQNFQLSSGIILAGLLKQLHLKHLIIPLEKYKFLDIKKNPMNSVYPGRGCTLSNGPILHSVHHANGHFSLSPCPIRIGARPTYKLGYHAAGVWHRFGFGQESRALSGGTKIYSTLKFRSKCAIHSFLIIRYWLYRFDIALQRDTIRDMVLYRVAVHIINLQSVSIDLIKLLLYTEDVGKGINKDNGLW